MTQEPSLLGKEHRRLSVVAAAAGVSAGDAKGGRQGCRDESAAVEGSAARGSTAAAVPRDAVRVDARCMAAEPPPSGVTPPSASTLTAI